MLSVLLQEPRRLVAEGMAGLLAQEPDVEVLLVVTDPMRLTDADTPSGTAAVLSLETDERVLFRVVRELRRRSRDIRLIGTYGPSDRAPTGTAALRSLAGVVPHDEGSAALLAALRGATPVIRHCLHGGADRRSCPPALTPRERDVLVLLAGGCSAQEASDRLRISRKTVENHKQRLFSKLGVQSQAQAVATAMRAGAMPVAPFDGLSA